MARLTQNPPRGFEDVTLVLERRIEFSVLRDALVAFRLTVQPASPTDLAIGDLLVQLEQVV